MTTNYKLNCPVETTLSVIGGKWKPLILWRLKSGVRRFGELQRLIPGVARKVLTQHLRELERDGIVTRKVYGEVPPRVEYSLSPYGQTLRPLLGELCDWGKRHDKRIAKKSEATPALPKRTSDNLKLPGAKPIQLIWAPKANAAPAEI